MCGTTNQTMIDVEELRKFSRWANKVVAEIKQKEDDEKAKIMDDIYPEWRQGNGTENN